ncbi:MAG TPA: hypothetical protein VIM56_06165 [Rhizomicrobium sp.]
MTAFDSNAMLNGVEALVRRALPVAKLQRNGGKPQRVDPAGNVVIRDGTPEIEGEELSPHVYYVAHRIQLEIAAFQQTGVSATDALKQMLASIGNELVADPTLGGLVELIEADAVEDDDLEDQGTPSGEWANVALIAHYATSSLLF